MKESGTKQTGEGKPKPALDAVLPETSPEEQKLHAL